MVSRNFLALALAWFLGEKLEPKFFELPLIFAAFLPVWLKSRLDDDYLYFPET